jgi:hypothetical protein
VRFSIARIGFACFDHYMHTSQELVRRLSMGVRNWCAPWAYASVPYAHAQHAHQFSHFSNIQHAYKELMRALSMCVRNWCVRCWAYESGTDAYTEHSRQELICALSAAPSKHAEHTCQDLMCTLSIWIRNWCICSAHQELMRTLSVNISFLRVCSA